jgi:hypothetical protein
MTLVETETQPTHTPAAGLQDAPVRPVSTDLTSQLRANLIHNVEATATRAKGDLALWEM